MCTYYQPSALIPIPLILGNRIHRYVCTSTYVQNKYRIFTLQSEICKEISCTQHTVLSVD
jgi:hypothetical protein